MRDAFSHTLVRLALSDPRVLLLTGDHGYSMFDEFRTRCGNQYINLGVAEQNMVGMAAGLARVGYRPVVYGLAAFVPIRTLEQIKLDIAHDRLPVVLIGDGAGLVYSQLGISHQSTEDIACTRALPHLEVLSPADRYEMEISLNYAFESKRPVYLRMGKADRGDVHKAQLPPLALGEPIEVQSGLDGRLAFIATGSMVLTALAIAQNYPGSSVWSAPFLKPLSRSHINAIAERSQAIVVMEEHSIHGGLSSAVAEITSQHTCCRILPIGTRDRYSANCGSYEYLLQEHRLDHSSIQDTVSDFVRTL